MRPFLCRRNTKDADAPAEHVDAQSPAQRPSLQEEVRGKLAAEVGDVEDCGEPGVLLADESSVVAEAEDGLGAEGGFVGLLDAVAEPLGGLLAIGGLMLWSVRDVCTINGSR